MIFQRRVYVVILNTTLSPTVFLKSFLFWVRDFYPEITNVKKTTGVLYFLYKVVILVLRPQLHNLVATLLLLKYIFEWLEV